uniref:Neural cell adhesion molecule L1-like n=1 Tax=Echeneis naucrates TaxID=173247 RepID=A0A665X5Y5_ECHNA
MITTQPESVTVFSVEDLVMSCEASGSPPPIFRWTKDGEEFDPGTDPELKVAENAGSFAFYTLSNTMDTLKQYQGKYVCYASNELGTAVSNEATLSTDGNEKKVSVKSEAGSSIVLKCNPPQSSMEPIIHWMDWKLHHIKLSKRVVVGKDGNLYFAYLTTEDSRNDYTCNVQYLATRTILAKEPITLTVAPSNSLLRNKRPQMMRPTGSHSVYHALRGQTMELECIVQGHPTPDVTWLRKDGELSESRTSKEMFDRRLHFTNISESDAGEYQCSANNSQGKLTHIYTVIVEAAPYWTKEPVSQLYAPGETVRLDCQADGIPTPTISWTINGIPLSGQRTLTSGGSLILNDVSFGDTAIYQCQASNKHGTIITNTNVYVIELPPQILSEDRNIYTFTEGQKASLECETFGSPKPKHDSPKYLFMSLFLFLFFTVHLILFHQTLIFFVDTEYVVEFEDQGLKDEHWEELKKVRGSEQHASLPLWPYMSYRFRVIAINEVGRSDPSKPSEIYNTPAEAPDNNPEDVRSESTNQNTLVVTWQEMDQRNFNGPNFRYMVLWRRAVGSGPYWHVNSTAAPPFVVNDVGNFSAFEIKVQAVNDIGEGPEPDPVIGYSGEDVPLDAPMNVGVVLINSTTIKASWAPVEKAKVRGHLLGYKESEETKVVETGPNEERRVISDLRPYSHYNLAMTVFNSKGEGPASETLEFKTHEGVPGPPTSLMLDSPSETEMTLHWTPPGQPNGVLIGYLLQYQRSDTNHQLYETQYIFNLDRHSHYRFYLRGRTTAGDGEPIMREGATTLDGAPPAFVNLSAGENAVNLSWVAKKRHRNVRFQIYYLNKKDGRNWKQSEKVNSSQSFYQLQGLTPGSQYLLHKNPLSSVQPSFATQGWFIGVVSAIVLLLLILLILCFIKRSKGGKYSVKDKEEGPMDSEARPMKDETFGEYSYLEEKRTTSQASLCEESKLCSQDNLDFNGSSAMTMELNIDESLVSQLSRPSEGTEVLHGVPDNSPLNPTTVSAATNGMPNSVTILD